MAPFLRLLYTLSILIPCLVALTVPPVSNPSLPLLPISPSPDGEDLTLHPDPFVYHLPSMHSTWTYHAFHSHLPRLTTARAWHKALLAARGPSESLIGTETQRWSAEGVEITLTPGPEMTWGVLIEGIREGVVLSKEERGYEFSVTVEGKEMGRGSVGMKRGVSWRAEQGKALLTLPGAGVRNLTLPDPYIWHLSPMISTWVFHSFRGHLSRRSADLAWDRAYKEATHGHDADDAIGGHMKRWSGGVPDDGIVDVVIYPGPGMTWRMLAEAFNGAEKVIFQKFEFGFTVFAEGVEGEVGTGETLFEAHMRRIRRWTFSGTDHTVDLVIVPRPEMTWTMVAEALGGADFVSRGQKEYQFIIMADGVVGEVGYGQMTMRNKAASENTLSARTKEELDSTVLSNSSLQPWKANVIATSIRDPFIWHTDDMISTWEYYGFHGRLSQNGCEQIWVDAFIEALMQDASGAGDDQLGTQARHWSVRVSHGYIDLVLIPRGEMTWRMMSEGFWGATEVCEARKEYQFVAIATGIEGEIGLGHIAMRLSDTARRGLLRWDVD
ncbi:MAG: hypothetical protein Q9170_003481 [Blastenia crenularia]